MMPEIDAALTFYRDLLGFQITDFMGPPVSLYFMHVNTRHHSLAIAQGSRSRMHYMHATSFYPIHDRLPTVPLHLLSPAWPYSSAAMKSTIFDSDCICLTILPTSSFGSLVSESRMR